MRRASVGRELDRRANSVNDLFHEGETCWRRTAAHRLAFLVDTETYYSALFQALHNARQSVFILGWAFDSRTRLAPDGREGPNDPDEIGQILIALTRATP